MELEVQNTGEDGQHHDKLRKALVHDPKSHAGPDTYTLETQLRAIGSSSEILSSPAHPLDTVTFAISHLKAVRILRPGIILGPVTLPEDEAAISRWLAARGHDVSNLMDGIAMCEATGETASPRFYRRFLTFVAAARRHGVPEEDLPDEIDFFKGRAWPKVLATVAAVARVVDMQGWMEVGGWTDEDSDSIGNGADTSSADAEASETSREVQRDTGTDDVVVERDGTNGAIDGDDNATTRWDTTGESHDANKSHVSADASQKSRRGGDKSVPTWTKRVLSESWNGDEIVREMISIIDQDCCVVVAGSQGGGKSATIDTLMGRSSMLHSHALTYSKPESDWTPSQREAMWKYKYLAALHWPHFPIEIDMPFGSNAVDRVFAKLDGHMMKFVELPSLEDGMDALDESGAIHSTQHGVMRDIIDTLQRDYADVVLVVDRLDEFDERRFTHSLRRLQKLYGMTSRERMIVVLTHGASLPPGDLSYTIWVHDRLRVVREACRRNAGDQLNIPILIVENSTGIGESASNRRKFGEEFLQAFRTIIAKRMISGPLHPVPTRRWWESYAAMLGAAFLITRIR